MPRENFMSDVLGIDVDEKVFPEGSLATVGDSDVFERHYGFEVNWGRDDDFVSITPTLTDRGLFVEVNKVLKTLGKPLITEKEWSSSYGGFGSRSFGLPYVGFNKRRGVNKLISILKRARDHAFGKDE